MSSGVLTIVAVEDPGRRADGIRDYTRRLVDELGREGTFQPRLIYRRPTGGWTGPARGRAMRSAGIPRDVRDADVVLVQYNPFWYGRRGFAPALPAFLWNLRRLRRRPVIGLMVHETFVNPRNLRWAVMGAWQRGQLHALLAAAEVRFCSIERWAEQLRHALPRRDVHHLPVGSNLPDMSHLREESRASLGVDGDTTVIACFGLRHPERLQDHTMGAANAIARAGRRVLLLNLGNGPCDVHFAGRVTVRSPGFLEEEPLAALLSSSDLFLAPYLDGVSTRRTTVMAALQHRIPVVGTSGYLTDRAFSDASSALALVPVGQADAFVAEASRLADDPDERRLRGDAGRRLYERQFDWPVITSRLVEQLQRPTGSPSLRSVPAPGTGSSGRDSAFPVA